MDTDMPSAPPPAAGAPGAVDPQGAVDAVGEAEADGKLAGLQSLMDDHGWDLSAAKLILLAQKDERTRGKTPDELASMIEEDNSLYDDLEAYQPGGKLDRGDEPEAPPEEEPEPSEEMGGYLGGSASMKKADPKKAMGAMKDAGASSPDELDGDFDKKAAFMKKMAR